MIPESETMRILRTQLEDHSQDQNQDGDVDDSELVPNEHPLVELFKHIVWFSEFVATIVVVTWTWDQGEANCFRLREWVLVFSFRHIIMMPLNLVRWIKRERNEPPGRVDRVLNWMNGITFFWNIFGQWLIYSGTCIHSKVLRVYVIITIMVFYIQLTWPIILMFFLCICLPCVWIIVRAFRKPRTAIRSTVKKLKTRKWTKEEVGDLESDKEKTCVICYLDYEVDEVIKTLPCGHEYHADCVDRWLQKHNRTCPTCRHDITKKIKSPPQSSIAENSDEKVMQDS